MNIFKAQARLAAVEKLFADAGIDMEKALAEGLEAAISANDEDDGAGDESGQEESPEDEAQPADDEDDGAGDEPGQEESPEDETQPADDEDDGSEPTEAEILASKLAEAEARADAAEQMAKEAQAKAEAMSAEQLKALRNAPPVVDGNAQGSSVYETYQAISDPAERAQFFAAHREEILRGQKANNQHGRA